MGYEKVIDVLKVIGMILLLLFMLMPVFAAVMSWVGLWSSIQMYLNWPIYDYEDYYIRSMILDPFDFIMPIFITWLAWWVWKPILKPKPEMAEHEI